VFLPLFQLPNRLDKYYKERELLRYSCPIYLSYSHIRA
jgi:hypothetical protein